MGIVEDFYANRDTEKAPAMSAYTKNRFRYLGIQKPKRAELEKEFLRESKKAKIIDWCFVEECWELPEREFQYLALDYLLALKGSLEEGDIEKAEKLITEKSWWDTVDMLASGITGELCSRYPHLRDERIIKWAEGDNMWLKRAAILFQLKYKEKTDTKLLSRVILMNSGTREFFIDKAIGWVLREYSKTDQQWVRTFIMENKLSSLSVREASKYLK
jgi:3-methyladenine DNA glycosylase AlkD